MSDLAGTGHLEPVQLSPLASMDGDRQAAAAAACYNELLEDGRFAATREKLAAFICPPAGRLEVISPFFIGVEKYRRLVEDAAVLIRRGAESPRERGRGDHRSARFRAGPPRVQWTKLLRTGLKASFIVQEHVEPLTAEFPLFPGRPPRPPAAGLRLQPLRVGGITHRELPRASDVVRQAQLLSRGGQRRVHGHRVDRPGG